MDNPTVLEISGKVDTLTVNANAVGSNVKLDEKSQVKDVTINGNIEFSSDAPINDLVLNASSNLTLNSSVASLQLTDKASDTKATLGVNSVVANVVTTVPVEISGTGKVENVVTDKEENITGEVKADNVEVKENPFNEVKPSATPSATPEPTVGPTPRPTAKPTPTPIPSVAPTPVPTPTPKVTVTFELDGYTVAPQTIDKGAKATKPEVTLTEEEYAGSYVVWFDLADKEFDFSSTVSTATTLKGKVVSGVKDKDTLIAAISSDKVKNIYFESDISVGTSGIFINYDVNIYGNNKTVSSNVQNAIKVMNDSDLNIYDLTIDAKAMLSRGIQIAAEVVANITLTNTTIIASQRGITYMWPEPVKETPGTINLLVKDSVIKNSMVTDYDRDSYEHVNVVAGIYLADSIGNITFDGSQVLGFSYGVNATTNRKGLEYSQEEKLHVNIIGSTFKNWSAINVWGAHGIYSIKDSTLVGVNNKTGEQQSFATIVFNSDIYDQFDGKQAISNELIIENSTITNYQSPESIGKVKQHLIRIDSGVDKLTFKGKVNLVDTTGQIESAMHLENMDSDKINDFINNGIVYADNATVKSATTGGAELPITIAPNQIPLISNARITYNQANETIEVDKEIQNDSSEVNPNDENSNENDIVNDPSLPANGEENESNNENEIANEPSLPASGEEEEELPFPENKTGLE